MSLGFIRNSREPQSPRISSMRSVPRTLTSQQQTAAQEDEQPVIRKRVQRPKHSRVVHDSLYGSSVPKCGLIVLLLVNLLLCGAHVGLGVWIVQSTITFPITVFETLLKRDVIGNFTCVYTFGNNGDDDYCLLDEYKTDRRRSQCSNVDLNISTQSLFQDSTGSPLLSAYHLRRFTFGMDDYSDERGTELTQGVLIAIAFVTAAFHLLYATLFACMLIQSVTKRRRSLLDYFVQMGGMPSRWIEYSITASLMSVFVANVANVFDLYALASFFLATFALQYFGLLIERLSVMGQNELALFVLYVPGFALFVLTWAPLVRQLLVDVAKLSCANWNDDDFSYIKCETTCFGDQVPIATFTAVLVLLFVVFPLIAVGKIFVLGGYSAWSDPMLRCLPSRKTAFVLKSMLNVPAFIVFFCAIAPLLSIKSLILTQLLPFGSQHATIASYALKQQTFLLGEFGYALASGSSKVFLFVFFVTSFTTRNW